MAITGKFVYVRHHFILLRLNPCELRVDREEWWFEHSMPWLRVCLSAEGAKNVSRRLQFPLRAWGSLTIVVKGKFLYMTHHFILLQVNRFDLVFHR